MDSRVEFDINNSLKEYLADPQSVETPAADASLDQDPESLTPQVANDALNSVVDAIAENPESLLNSAHLDTLQFLLKYAKAHNLRHF